MSTTMGKEHDWKTEVIHFMDGLAGQLASNTESRPILNWVVGRVSELMRADEACVRISAPREALHTQAFRRTHGAGSWPEPLSSCVMGYLHEHNEPLITNDLLRDPRFPGLSKLDAKVRSMLAAPLMADGRIVGCLAVSETRPGREWTDSETQTLVRIARHSGSAIEHATLAELRRRITDLEEERKRRAESNRQAAEVQQHALPQGVHEWQGWRAYGSVVPAEDVGGDAFDFRPIGPGHLSVAVADVEGKGLPAAIMMMAILAQLRTASGNNRTIRDVMMSLEDCHAEVHCAKSVTVAYAAIDLATGTLEYHLAGHPWPLIRRRDGSIEALKHGSIPVGWDLPHTRDTATAVMRPGDALLLYSDGVLDAMDIRNEDFGMARIKDLWHGCAGLAPEHAVANIHQCLRDYCTPRRPGDDITVAVIAAPDHP